MQTFIHYFSHFGVIFFIAIIFFRDNWKKAYLIMLATMLVDIDHLMARPIFEANRCGIGFHPFHSFYAIPFYVILLFFRGTPRIIGVGLLFHMVTDFNDCIFMFIQSKEHYIGAPAYNLMNKVANLLNI